MMRWWWVLVIVAVFGADVHAQTVLDYGDTVSGSISAGDTVQRYTFDGAGGDVVIVHMRSVDRSLQNLLDAPRILLEDEAGVVIADTFALFPLDDATLMAQLPADGRYTVIATRDEQMTVPSIGNYTLTLLKADVLTAQAPIISTISTEDFGQFYVVEAASAFDLRLERLSGEFGVQITIGALNDDPLVMQDVLAVGYGRGLTRTTLGAFPAEEMILVTINQHPDDYYADFASAEYRLSLITVD